jgi:hypothetical protein
LSEACVQPPSQRLSHRVRGLGRSASPRALIAGASSLRLWFQAPGAASSRRRRLARPLSPPQMGQQYKGNAYHLLQSNCAPLSRPIAGAPRAVAARGGKPAVYGSESCPAPSDPHLRHRPQPPPVSGTPSGTALAAPPTAGNHFASDLCLQLVGRPAPSWVRGIFGAPQRLWGRPPPANPGPAMWCRLEGPRHTHAHAAPASTACTSARPRLRVGRPCTHACGPSHTRTPSSSPPSPPLPRRHSHGPPPCFLHPAARSTGWRGWR